MALLNQKEYMTSKPLHLDPRRIMMKLRTILHYTKYCCICLANDNELKHFDACLTGEKLTLKQIMEEIFGDDVPKILFGEYICKRCVQVALNCYSFIYNIKKTADIYVKYLSQLDSKLDDVIYHMKCSNILGNTLIILDNLLCDKKFDESQINDELNTECSDKYLSDVKKYKCECCNKIFLKRSSIINHLTKGNLKGEISSKIKCPQCPENPCKHEKYLSLYREQKISKKDGIKCADCEYVCWTMRTLISHVNKDHLDSYSEVCEICGKIFYLQYNYQRHGKYCHSETPRCPFCDLAFSSAIIEKHKFKCGGKDRSFKCDKCPASFDSVRRAKLHKKKHIKKYPCDMCSKVLTSENFLKVHKNKLHCNKMGFKHHTFSTECSVCHTDWGTPKKLHKHMSTHSLDEKHKCKLCKSQFFTRQHYLKHINKHRMQKLKQNAKVVTDGYYQCDYCEYSTRNSEYLEAHVNRKHLNISPYGCDICEKRFANETSLRGHIKRHAGVKYRYVGDKRVCDVCGDVLALSSLRKHMRLHTGEEPYSCDLCDGTFKSASQRNMHKERKHKEKSVACPLACGAIFHAIENMRKHVKKVHWKSKEKFDCKKLEGLSEADYDLFRDRRLILTV